MPIFQVLFCHVFVVASRDLPPITGTVVVQPSHVIVPITQTQSVELATQHFIERALVNEAKLEAKEELESIKQTAENFITKVEEKIGLKK